MSHEQPGSASVGVCPCVCPGGHCWHWDQSCWTHWGQGAELHRSCGSSSWPCPPFHGLCPLCWRRAGCSGSAQAGRRAGDELLELLESVGMMHRGVCAEPATSPSPWGGWPELCSEGWWVERQRFGNSGEGIPPPFIAERDPAEICHLPPLSAIGGSRALGGAVSAFGTSQSLSHLCQAPPAQPSGAAQRGQTPGSFGMTKIPSPRPRRADKAELQSPGQGGRC